MEAWGYRPLLQILSTWGLDRRPCAKHSEGLTRPGRQILPAACVRTLPAVTRFCDLFSFPTTMNNAAQVQIPPDCVFKLTSGLLFSVTYCRFLRQLALWVSQAGNHLSSALAFYLPVTFASRGKPLVLRASACSQFRSLLYLCVTDKKQKTSIHRLGLQCILPLANALFYFPHYQPLPLRLIGKLIQLS